MAFSLKQVHKAFWLAILIPNSFLNYFDEPIFNQSETGKTVLIPLLIPVQVLCGLSKTTDRTVIIRSDKSGDECPAWLARLVLKVDPSCCKGFRIFPLDLFGESLVQYTVSNIPNCFRKCSSASGQHR